MSKTKAKPPAKKNPPASSGRLTWVHWSKLHEVPAGKLRELGRTDTGGNGVVRMLLDPDAQALLFIGEQRHASVTFKELVKALAGQEHPHGRAVQVKRLTHEEGDLPPSDRLCDGLRLSRDALLGSPGGIDCSIALRALLNAVAMRLLR